MVLAKKIAGEDVIVTRDEVLKYVKDEAFLFYLSVYQYVKLWGMPNGNGWANEPSDILDAITALEIEQREIEHDEIENAKSSHKQPRQ